MDLPDSHMVPPAVRITVLLRLASEGFQDAFGAGPAWLELPAADLAELREAVGPDRVEQLTHTIGLREGSDYRAGGAAGTVALSDAAHTGALGLMGLAALPSDVVVEESAEGARYQVPEDWFIAQPAGGA
jgi:pimeloyl-ACP methyl ester carboxylesterase